MFNYLNIYRDTDDISAKVLSTFAFGLSFFLVEDLRLRCP